MRITGYEMRAPAAPLERAGREVAGPGAGEVVVAVAGCGVCHTDLGFLFDGVPTRHALPLVLGHEIAGRVAAEGDGVSGLAGRSVIVPAVIPCGRCALCARGRGDICRAQVFPGNDVHGGFASHVVVPARGLCAVPGTLKDSRELARLSVVADAVSTAFAAVRKSGLGPGSFAVFVGIGGVGGFGAQIAAALGARVLALDVDDERLARMKEHGAAFTLNVRGLSAKDVKAAVRNLAKDAGLPPAEWTIFETSGTGPGQETAMNLLVPGATLMVVGYHPKDVTVRLSNLMAFAARAEGVWGCPPDLFPGVLDLVLGGQVALEPFTEFHPMSAINTVFQDLHAGRLRRRPILIPDFEENSAS